MKPFDRHGNQRKLPKKIYLAIPYTGMEEESFKTVNKVAGKLMKADYIVFSPISHTHPIACEVDLPKNWKFWKQQDEMFIDWCDELWIVKCGDKWEKSVGVKEEIKIAKENKKRIVFIEENMDTFYFKDKNYLKNNEYGWIDES